MYPVDAAFVATAATLFTPFTALADEVTFSVVEPLAPGARFKAEAVYELAHPVGTELVKVKFAVAHDAVSLFLTVTEKGTGVPAITEAACAGEIVTVGLARLQGAGTPFTDTFIVAPLVLTEVTVKDNFAAESVKVCPTASAASL